MNYELLRASPLRCVYATISLMVEKYVNEVLGQASMSIESDTYSNVTEKVEGKQAGSMNGSLRCAIAATRVHS